MRASRGGLPEESTGSKVSKKVKWAKWGLWMVRREKWAGGVVFVLVVEMVDEWGLSVRLK